VEYLVAQAAQLDANLICIDPGDLQRLDRCAPMLSPAVGALQRQAALRQADRLLAGTLRVARASSAMVLVLAPDGRLNPDGKRRTLTPLIWYDPNAPPGLLL